MKYVVGLSLLLGLVSACSDDGSSAPGTEEGNNEQQVVADPTFYEHVAPVFQAKCVNCHQADGIAPFALDDYAAASERAPQIAAYTADRIMPPFLIETGGECGDFDESIALTEAEIELIGNWARTGAAEGTPVALETPVVPQLEGGRDFSGPMFTPRVNANDPLAQFDEYRCFPVQPGLDADTFVTGYDVLPGNAALVHHVLAFVVDPNAMSEDGTKTNQQVMDELRAVEPDRDGWSCFGMAGDNVSVESAPVIWAPGQGIVEYPGGLGVKLRQDRQLVIQIHYNMADSPPAPDQTRVRLQLSDTVDREGVFILDDDLLRSLYESPMALPPDQESFVFSWERSGNDYGFPPGLSAEIVGLFPHMHERGHRYTFEVAQGDGEYTCQGRVNRWDFNWQRIYNYDTPLTFNANSRFRVTCDYDTSGVTEPVLPGWGTRNEMCFVMLMLALPPGISL